MSEKLTAEPMVCGVGGCTAEVVRIERYQTTVAWEKDDDGAWDLGAYDNGTHFHLFCPEGHELKCWGRELPKELQRVVYPADQE